jgi:hypothetical protein
MVEEVAVIAVNVPLKKEHPERVNDFPSRD